MSLRPAPPRAVVSSSTSIGRDAPYGGSSRDAAYERKRAEFEARKRGGPVAIPKVVPASSLSTVTVGPGAKQPMPKLAPVPSKRAPSPIDRHRDLERRFGTEWGSIGGKPAVAFPPTAAPDREAEKDKLSRQLASSSGGYIFSGEKRPGVPSAERIRADLDAQIAERDRLRGMSKDDGLSRGLFLRDRTHQHSPEHIRRTYDEQIREKSLRDSRRSGAISAEPGVNPAHRSAILRSESARKQREQSYFESGSTPWEKIGQPKPVPRSYGTGSPNHSGAQIPSRYPSATAERSHLQPPVARGQRYDRDLGPSLIPTGSKTSYGGGPTSLSIAAVGGALPPQPPSRSRGPPQYHERDYPPARQPVREPSRQPYYDQSPHLPPSDDHRPSWDISNPYDQVPQSQQPPISSGADDGMYRPSIRVAHRGPQMEMEQYRAELAQQVAAKKAREEAQKRERDKWELAKAHEMESFNPFGRGGAGAPIKARDGRSITNLQKLRATATSPTGVVPPTAAEFQAVDHRSAREIEIDRLASLAAGSSGTQPEGSGLTEEQRYRQELKQQMEEARRRKEEAEKAAKAREEADNLRLQREIEELNRKQQEEMEREKPIKDTGGGDDDEGGFMVMMPRKKRQPPAKPKVVEKPPEPVQPSVKESSSRPVSGISREVSSRAQPAISMPQPPAHAQPDQPVQPRQPYGGGPGPISHPSSASVHENPWTRDGGSRPPATGPGMYGFPSGGSMPDAGHHVPHHAAAPIMMPPPRQDPSDAILRDLTDKQREAEAENRKLRDQMREMEERLAALAKRAVEKPRESIPKPPSHSLRQPEPVFSEFSSLMSQLPAERRSHHSQIDSANIDQLQAEILEKQEAELRNLRTVAESTGYDGRMRRVLDSLGVKDVSDASYMGQSLAGTSQFEPVGMDDTATVLAGGLLGPRTAGKPKTGVSTFVDAADGRKHDRPGTADSLTTTTTVDIAGLLRLNQDRARALDGISDPTEMQDYLAKGRDYVQRPPTGGRSLPAESRWVDERTGEEVRRIRTTLI